MNQYLDKVDFTFGLNVTTEINGLVWTLGVVLFCDVIWFTFESLSLLVVSCNSKWPPVVSCNSKWPPNKLSAPFPGVFGKSRFLVYWNKIWIMILFITCLITYLQTMNVSIAPVSFVHLYDLCWYFQSVFVLHRALVMKLISVRLTWLFDDLICYNCVVEVFLQLCM